MSPSNSDGLHGCNKNPVFSLSVVATAPFATYTGLFLFRINSYFFSGIITICMWLPLLRITFFRKMLTSARVTACTVAL